MRKEINFNTIEDVDKITKFAMEFKEKTKKTIWISRLSAKLSALSTLGLYALIGKKDVYIVFPDNLPPETVQTALAKAGY